MQTTHNLVPREAREATYELLASASPKRVVIDTDLKAGEWYVVRGPTTWELERAERQARAYQNQKKERA